MSELLTITRSAAAEPQVWLYPTNASNRHWGQHARASAGETWNAIREDALDGPSLTEWSLSNGYRSMRPGDLVLLYAGGQHQRICAAAHVQYVLPEPRDGTWWVNWRWDRGITHALAEVPLRHSRTPTTAYTFNQLARSPQRVTPATAAVVDAWLAAVGTAPDDGEETDDALELTDDDLRSRRLARIALRPGQPRFRDMLLQAYVGHCAFTGCTVPTALEAAHIRPYRGPSHHRVDNGLLLRRDLHALFDAHLVTVTEHHTIDVHPSVRTDPTYDALHGAEVRTPADPAARPHPAWLAEHRAAAPST